MDIVPLDLKLPIHVSLVKVDGKELYQVKPLFFSYTTAVHRRFESALSRFRNSIQNSFKGWVLEPDTIDEMQWFMLNPKVDFKLLNLTIPLKGKLTKTGKFGVAIFEVQHLTFACLPQFQNFIFMVNKNERGRFDIAEQTAPIIGKLLHRFEEEDSEEYNFSNFVSTSKEFVTEIKVTVQVGHIPSLLHCKSYLRKEIFLLEF